MIFPLPRSILPALALTAGACLLSACTPKYDWREIRGTAAPFVAALPAKPSTMSRPINLDGVSVTMSMTAAEVGGTTFAVGSAQLPDAAKAQAALAAMKVALVKNINGSIKGEKSVAPQAQHQDVSNAVEIEAVGSRAGSPKTLLLMARFVAKGERVYQLVVVGEEKSVSREAADTFFTSFKFN